MDWSESFLPETNLGQMANVSGTRIEELEEENENLIKHIEELEKENENLIKQIHEKNEEVLYYARRMQQEEFKSRDLARDVNVMQEKLNNCCSRLSQEEEGAKTLERERDQWKKRLLKEQEKCLQWRNSSLASQKMAKMLQDECARLKQRLSEAELGSGLLQQKLDSCKGRLTQGEENNKVLKKQYREMKNRSLQEEGNVKVLQKHCEEWIERYAMLRDAYNDDVKNMAETLERVNEQLVEKDNELRRLAEELKMKTQRLASTFERRLKHRQVNVENTSQLNSPSEVENDFRDFLDGERMEAWDIIETLLFSTRTIENDVKIRYLACIIFVAAYEQMEEAREAAKDFFSNISRHLIDEAPRKSQELCIKRKESGCSAQFPVTFNISVEHQGAEDNKDVLDDLMLSLKQSAHSCDLKCFEEDVRQMVLKRWKKCLKEETEMTLLPPFPDKAEDVLSELGDYIKTSIRLSWKMVTQAPPLGLEYRQLKFSPKYHTLTRLQNNNEGTGQGQCEKIVYLWPGLLENEERVIFPGEVLCI